MTSPEPVDGSGCGGSVLPPEVVSTVTWEIRLQQKKLVGGADVLLCCKHRERRRMKHPAALSMFGPDDFLCPV